jgi:hypothetical protein
VSGSAPSVTATYDDVVNLRVTIRADFGTRSFVTITGLHNFDYYDHYGYWSKEGFSETTDLIEITPRMLVALIRYAHDNGWEPETIRSNQHLELTNQKAKSLVTADKARTEDEAST